jgi:hypothetical protein
MFMNRWLRFSDGFPVWIMRLVRRDRVRFVDSGHGEVPAPVVAGTLEKLREPFIHYPFSKGFADWVNRHNRYSTLEAALELKEQSRARFRDLVTFDSSARRETLRTLSRKLPFRPLLRFCFHYVLKGGILDGRAGWEYAHLMSMYEGLIVLKRREEELRRAAVPENGAVPAMPEVPADSTQDRTLTPS